MASTYSLPLARRCVAAIVAMSALSGQGLAEDGDDATRRAVAAQEAGDWRSAVKQWAIAHELIPASDRSSTRTASISYEYGRALGVTCQFERSSRLLQDALAIDEKTGGPVAMTLVELARLHLDSGNPQHAIPYFNRALPVLDGEGAEHRDADGFTHFLEEFATAAAATGDGTRAQLLHARIETLRTRHVHAHGPSTRTPYGTQCEGPNDQAPALNNPPTGHRAHSPHHND